MGDPIYSRIKAELEEYDIMVHSFIFSTTSKETGYKILQQELANHRLTYPAGERVSRMKKYDRFYGQVCSLLKFYRGNVMVVERPKDEKDSADDYPDSLMMLSWLVNVGGTMEIEVSPNPFIGRNAKWAQVDMLKTAKSWFRSKMNPYTGSDNKRKVSRKWD